MLHIVRMRDRRTCCGKVGTGNGFRDPVGIFHYTIGSRSRERTARARYPEEVQMCMLSWLSDATGRNLQSQKISTTDTRWRKVRIGGLVGSVLVVITDSTKSWRPFNIAASSSSRHLFLSNLVCQPGSTTDAGQLIYHQSGN